MIAVRILLREFGLCGTIRIALAIRRLQRRGEPFGALPPPANDREAKSRAQIGPAILLYRSLPRDALRITEEIVVASARAFLRKTIGPIEKVDARRAGEAFFNATLRWIRVAPEEVRFDVVACHFPVLCRAAGVPELAPVFCRGDAGFFRDQGLRFERTTTIAEGAPLCDFRITKPE